MKIEYNKVTWYSKLASILVFILCLPILAFYIGKIYERTYTKVAAPVVDISKNAEWTPVNMSAKDLSVMFEAADEYISKDSRNSAPYEIVLDGKFDRWIHLTITPHDSGIERTQMYMFKGGDGWKVEAYGTSFDEFCTKHFNVCI